MLDKKKLKLKPKQVIVSAITGKPEGIVLDIEDYEKLAALMEDFADLITMESLRDEEKYAIPWKKAVQKLKKNGTL